MAKDIYWLYVGCDHLLTLEGETRADDGTPLNAMSASWSLHSTEADALANTTPVATGTFSYVTGSDGKYRSVLESSSYTLVKGNEYWLRIVESEGSADGLRIIHCVAKYRGASSR